MSRGLIGSIGLVVLGGGLALWHTEATHPGAGREATQDAMNVGVPMIRGGAALTSEALLGSGQVLNSATVAVQNSGLGNMLTPTTEPGGGGVSPAADAPSPAEAP